MRIVSILGFAASVACFTAGCATSSRGPQQVQEVEPGTYSIGINRSSKTLLSSTDKATIGEAVDKAGESIHARAEGPNGATFVREAVVNLRGGIPDKLLVWQQGAPHSGVRGLRRVI
jgi:hypothetical protein